jgi:hypothetical protein
MSPDSPNKLEFVQIKLEYKYPEDLQTLFVTSMVVQHQPDFFTLSFFEAFPPPFINKSPEEQRTAIERLDHIDAKCVARIVVTPEKLVEFSKAINENLSNYQKMIKLQSK